MNGSVSISRHDSIRSAAAPRGLLPWGRPFWRNTGIGLVIEREKFPRYHIGESLIPFTFGPGADRD